MRVITFGRSLTGESCPFSLIGDSSVLGVSSLEVSTFECFPTSAVFSLFLSWVGDVSRATIGALDETDRLAIGHGPVRERGGEVRLSFVFSTFHCPSSDLVGWGERGYLGDFDFLESEGGGEKEGGGREEEEV